MPEPVLDLISIGRSSVDLYGQQIGGRLEDMASFSKAVGGCPTNIAIGTARLGLKSALLSRVGDEQSRGEIAESWRTLCARATRPAPIFCYPNGKANDFGARETHYFRSRGSQPAAAPATPATAAEPNAALEDWRGG